LQSVGNGVSLLPWRKITGVRRTGPAAPKPITGVPSEASTIVGKPAGNDVPTWSAARAAIGATSVATSTTARIPYRFIGCPPIRADR
jgi:hypothetical protein